MLAPHNVMPSPLRRTAAGRVAAGREAGRSFRDRMSSARFPVESWQFDELSRQVADSRPLREFVRGVIDGMLHGRAQESDVTGFVWLARRAFDLPRRPSMPSSVPSGTSLAQPRHTSSARSSLRSWAIRRSLRPAKTLAGERPPRVARSAARSHAAYVRNHTGIPPHARPRRQRRWPFANVRETLASAVPRRTTAGRDRRLRGVQLPFRKRLAPSDQRRSARGRERHLGRRVPRVLCVLARAPARRRRQGGRNVLVQAHTFLLSLASELGMEPAREAQ